MRQQRFNICARHARRINAPLNGNRFERKISKVLHRARNRGIHIVHHTHLFGLHPETATLLIYGARIARRPLIAFNVRAQHRAKRILVNRHHRRHLIRIPHNPQPFKRAETPCSSTARAPNQIRRGVNVNVRKHARIRPIRFEHERIHHRAPVASIAILIHKRKSLRGKRLLEDDEALPHGLARQA